jgi:N-carbamoylputrescine amidase
MTQKKIKVALLQHECVENKTHNLQRSIAEIEAAAKQGAQLIVLQELHSTPYFCVTQNPANFDLAETIPGETSLQLGALAKKLKVVIVASLFEKRGSGIYHNTAVVLGSDGDIAGLYRKMHIPDDPGYHEKFYFTQGDLGFTPISVNVAGINLRLGVLVCWDQWFPEAARLMALAGADLLLFPTAIGWDTRDTDDEQQRQLDAWITIQRAHAIANGLPLISCNRVGIEKDPSGNTAGAHFWGNSFICGPQGEFLARADDSAQSLITELDLTSSERVRRIWPFLRDRRIDAYHDILKRYRD